MSEKKSQSSCRLRSSRQKPIEYRPHIQHRLFKEDDLFDSRYSAFLRCKTSVIAATSSVFKILHQQLFLDIVKALSDDPSGFNIRTNESEQRLGGQRVKIRIIFLSTAFSDVDREFCMNLLQGFIEEKMCVSVINLDCNFSSSATDLLVECVEYLYRCLYLSRSDHLLGSAITKKKYRDTVLESSGNLLKEFCSLYSQSSQKLKNQVVILLRYGDKLLGDVLNDFILLLHDHLSDLIAVKVIAVYSDFIPVPLTQDKALHGEVEMTHNTTTSPFDVFDELMVRVLASQEIPVLLAPAAISWIYEAYSRQDCCVLNAIDRIVICLSRFFLQRKSVLCMYREFDWLRQLKLFDLESRICVELLSKKELIFQHSELYRSTVGRITYELFSYMDDRDLAATGLRSVIGQTKSERVESSKAVAATLEGLELQTALDCKYLTCLKLSRDFFLSKKNRASFPSALLWAAIQVPSGLFSTSENKPTATITITEDLIEEVIQQFGRISPSLMLRFWNDLLQVLADVPDDKGHDNSNSIPIRSSSGSSSSSSSGGGAGDSGSCIRMKIQCIQQFKVEVSMALVAIEEVVANLHRQGIDTNIGFLKLKDRNANEKLPQKSLSVKVTDVEILPPSASSSIGDGEEEKTLKEGKVILSYLDFYEYSLQDCANFLRVLNRSFRSIQRHEHGNLIYLDNESALDARNDMDGNIQARYMDGLVHPPTVQGRVLNADVCTLANKVRNLVSTESAEEWFDAFQSAAVKWPDLDTYLMEKSTGKTSAKSAGSKKRLSSGSLGADEEEGMSEKKKLSLMAQYFGVAPKLAEELCEPDNVLRLRFARAVSELERAGLIKCSKSEKSPDSIVISRQLFTWI